MSNSGTSGAKKQNFSDYNITSVNANTFQNEKFPELEDPEYPKQLIEKLEAQAKAANENQKSNHAITPGETKRQGHYQYRGPAYVHLKDGRGRYHEWPFKYLFENCTPGQQKMMLEKVEKLAKKRWVWGIVKDESEWKKSFKFPEPGSFPGTNKFFFLTTKLTHKVDPSLYFFFTKQGAPYAWAAHHLIPIEVFDSKKETHFDDKEQELIRQAGYDVNNGHNIVPLPTEEVPPHCLLLHLGSHSNYLKFARKKLKSVKDKLKEAMKSEKHEAFYPQLIKLLTATEDDLWDELKNLGKSSVKLYLQGTRPTSDLVKYISKGKRKSTGRRKLYPEGAMD